MIHESPRAPAPLLLQEADPALLLDPDGVCLESNPAADRELGRSGNPLAGTRPALELVDLGEPSLLIAARQAGTGSVERIGFRHPVTGHWLEGRASRVDGGVAIFLRDATEEHARETALVQSRHALLATTSGGRTGTFSVDLSSFVARFSAVASDIYGISTDPDGRLPWSDFRSCTHPDDRARTSECFDDVLGRPGKVADITYRVRRPDSGRERLVHVVGIVTRDDEGVATSLNCSVSDVTELQAAQDALVASEDRLRRTLDEVDAIVCFQEAEHAMSVSPAIERILGFRPDEVTSDTSWRALVHPDDLPECDRLWYGGDGRWAHEYRIRRSDGSYIWVEDRGRERRGPDGSIEVSVSVVTDITARRSLEAQLAQAQRLEAVGQLAGGLAHDMNNVLSAISGFGTFALQAVPPGSPAADDMQQVLVAAERAAAMTRQLLSFSRRRAPELRVVDVVQLLDGLAPMLVRLLGGNIGIEVVRMRDTALVLADPGQLEQVIVNLVVNARDAMPDGGELTIRVDAGLAMRSATTAGIPDRCVVIEVQDTGTGMDQATLSQVFTPYFTTKEVGKGTGLGLATVYGIVTGSGGTIGVTSAEGVGTTFRIELPCAGLPAGKQDQRNEAPATGDGAIHGAGALRQPCILVVEDESAVRVVTARMLRGLGYTVLEADSGHVALGLLADRSQRVDLVVSDVRMPGIQGAELQQIMQRHWPGIPVVFVSGHAPELDEGGHAAGLFRLVPKPFTTRELDAAVREALRASPVA